MRQYPVNAGQVPSQLLSRGAAPCQHPQGTVSPTRGEAEAGCVLLKGRGISQQKSGTAMQTSVTVCPEGEETAAGPWRWLGAEIRAPG